ncbi:MAG TPA: O-antigen ligase family protein [Myxococcota bacterium]|nr:O-antigen ligase family protein [Myxococcota bacterium]
MPYKRRTKNLESESAGLEDRADRPHAPHRSSWIVELPVFVLLFFTPMAIGTAHLWSSAIMLGLCLVAFAALSLRRRRNQRSFLLFPMGLALLAAFVVTLLQLVPLPTFLVRLLNPGAAELYDFVLDGTGLWGSGGFHSLSLDSPASAGELVRYLAYALVFVVVVNYFNDRHRARRLLKAVAWSGFAVALVGFFSKLFVAKAIWGFYPIPAGSFFFSTFVNSNHLAGFLGLCAPVTLGISLSARERNDRALYGFMGIITGVAVFMSLSRGGMVAFSAGMLFLFFIVATRRARRLRHTTAVQAAMVGVLLLAGYLAYDTIVKELKTLGDLSAVEEEVKIRSWAGTLPMMADYPVMGIGKGAYETIYPHYKTVSNDNTFTHAENQLLQVMVEWGPLFGLLFAGMFALSFFLFLSRTRKSLTMAGCLAGVFTVAVQNLVDFNLEVGGVALPFVVVLGILSAAPFSHAGKPRKGELRLRLPGRAAQLLAVASLIIAAIAVPYAAFHGISARSADLLEAVDATAEEPCGPGALGLAACEMLQYHPADFLAPLVTGKAYLEKGPGRDLGRAAHWLSRAMYLNPTSAVIHRLLGRALFMAGFGEQALTEYRLAAHWDPRILTATTTEVLRLTGDSDKVIQATPINGESYLRVARNLRALGKNAAAAKAAQLALDKDSSLITAMDLLADLAFAGGRYEEAAGVARRELELNPLHDQAYFIEGQVYKKQGDPRRAEKAWRNGLEQVPESSLLAYNLVELLLSEERFDEAEGIAARLQTFAPSDDATQARLQFLLGRINEAKGMLYEARGFYRLAARMAPGQPGYLLSVARMDERMDDWDDAERIYTELMAARYRPDEMRKRIKAVEEGRQKATTGAMMDTWVKRQGQDQP